MTVGFIPARAAPGRMASSRVALPNELRAALAADPEAKRAFDKLPPSHQRAHVEYVAEAKKPETRERRSAKTVETLRKGA